MELNNKNVTSFPVDFLGENTFFSSCGESLEDVINKFPNIESAQNTVVVTDPYLFMPNDEIYKNNVIKVFTSLNASKICYCSHNYPDTTLFSEISNSLGNCALEYINLTSKYHDRHWYCIESNKGFLTGTSLNGIGKQACCIETLSNETCIGIKQFLIQEGVIISE